MNYKNPRREDRQKTRPTPSRSIGQTTNETHRDQDNTNAPKDRGELCNNYWLLELPSSVLRAVLRHLLRHRAASSEKVVRS
jgi:hypothetical protein